MLKHLSLTNYRNHEKFELDLSQITVLIGKNGIGKTNILESIELISSCRSFRGDKRQDLIMFDKHYSRVCADDLEVFIQRIPRSIFQVKERGIKRKVADFVGILPSVVFSPESLEIIKGDPKERRRFLDIVISQRDHNYLRALQDYKRILTQRNSLLKLIQEGQANEDQLDYWDNELISVAEIITKVRQLACEQFIGLISQFYGTISGQKNSTVEIVYHAKAEGDFTAKLKSKRGIDIAAGLTTSGPHRDDLQFKLNNLETDKYASRGELRSVVLALKMSELKFLENGTQPILLLDDIFSEFDADRRAHLYDLVGSYQTLITTTERELLSAEILTKASVIEVK